MPREYYTKYRELLQGVVDKSETEFEKKLIYIAAGALGLSFSFISDIVSIADSSCKWSLITGWGLLTACILVNFISHILSKNFANKTIDDVDNFLGGGDDDASELRKKIEKRNKITNFINRATILLLISGIGSIIYFVSYNITNPIEKTEKHQTIYIMNEDNKKNNDIVTEGFSLPKSANIYDSQVRVNNGMTMPKPQQIIDTTKSQMPQETNTTKK